MTRGRLGLLIALAAVAPLPFSPAGLVVNNLVLAAAYVVMALGLNIIVGFAGLLDLGFVAFYAIGAYSASYLASGYWHAADVSVLSSAATSGIHLHLILVAAVAAAVAALAGTLIGIPTLRLRTEYVALVTLAFGEIIGRTALNGRAIHVFGGTLTYGPIGIGPIDRIELPFTGRLSDFDLRPWYWCALGLALLMLFVNVRLRGSRVGRAWIAVRDDETAAAVAGVPVVKFKLLAYATGAAFGAIAGVFLASYVGTINPSQFEFSFSIFVLAMVVCGGAGSIGGVVAGAVAVSAMTNYLLPEVVHGLPQKLGLDVDFSGITSGLYGLLLVLAVVLRPRFGPRGGCGGRDSNPH